MWLDELIARPYNEYTYKATRQNVSLCCTLHPADQDIRVAGTTSPGPRCSVRSVGRMIVVRLTAAQASDCCRAGRE